MMSTNSRVLGYTQVAAIKKGSKMIQEELVGDDDDVDQDNLEGQIVMAGNA